jgi:hypothetical protein
MSGTIKSDRRGCYLALVTLIVACGVGFELLLIFVVIYLAWSILSMYLRMKSLG